MKKYILLVLLLSGCAHTQETVIVDPPKVPRLPAHYDIKAARLPDIVDPSFGGIMVDGTESDIKYNSLSIKYNQLLDIYNCVRVSINERKDPITCLKN